MTFEVGTNGFTGVVNGTWDGNTTLLETNTTQYNATFETGYPYIGLPAPVFDNLADQLEQQDDDIDCDHGFCQAFKNCTEVNPLQDLTFRMGGTNFTIPMNSTFY